MVREVHVGIEDEGIRESVERVVQLLMGDEVEKPDDEMGGENGKGGRTSGGNEQEDDEDEKIVEIF